MVSPRRAPHRLPEGAAWRPGTYAPKTAMIASDNALSPIARCYVAIVIGVGFTITAVALSQLLEKPVGYEWFVLACLTLLSGSFTVRLPGVPVRLSVSVTFVVTAVLLFGAAAGTMVVVLDSLVICLWGMYQRRQLRMWYKVLFNVGASATSIWVAAEAFVRVAPHDVSTTQLILPVGLLAGLYFLVNTWLVAFAVGLEQHRSTIAIWRDNFCWLSLNYFGGASLAVLLIPYTRDTSLGLVSVIGIVPLLVLSYLTVRTSMGRVEDANRHLSQLNRLYMSTIETLAMAVDAKDQVTHGHIRRVQQYALALARVLGLKDEDQVKALEAAALLHDMGKLAVPEYILNKPGRLSAAEFERMKRHAAVGADILSAIDFPYPVVPIVRYHHESWDGTGYPDGLRGTDIPIGARILAVVDCFDALTSDRPYRPKLPDGDALHVLMQRRGTMYDPLVVDAFVAMYRATADRAVDTTSPQPALAAINESGQVSAREFYKSGTFEDIASSSEEMLTLYGLASALTGPVNLADAGDVIFKHLRRIVPASLCVFFIYDELTDELVAAHVCGDTGGLLREQRLALGERVSGWVAANRQSVVNSDPVLDFGDAARHFKPRLRSCLSTPLLVGDSLVGVLSLYANVADVFTDDHRRIVETVARQVAPALRHAADFEHQRATALRDHLTGLPKLAHLRQLMAASTDSAAQLGQPLALLYIDIRSLRDVNQRHGRQAGDAALAQVTRVLRSLLRMGDIVFRCESDEFVVLLTGTDVQTARMVADRISGTISATPLEHEARQFQLGVDIGLATSPADGNALSELVRVARERIARPAFRGRAGSAIH